MFNPILLFHEKVHTDVNMRNKKPNKLFTLEVTGTSLNQTIKGALGVFTQDGLDLKYDCCKLSTPVSI